MFYSNSLLTDLRNTNYLVITHTELVLSFYINNWEIFTDYETLLKDSSYLHKVEDWVIDDGIKIFSLDSSDPEVKINHILLFSENNECVAILRLDNEIDLINTKVNKIEVELSFDDVLVFINDELKIDYKEHISNLSNTHKSLKKLYGSNRAVTKSEVSRSESNTLFYSDLESVLNNKSEIYRYSGSYFSKEGKLNEIDIKIPSDIYQYIQGIIEIDEVFYYILYKPSNFLKLLKCESYVDWCNVDINYYDFELPLTDGGIVEYIDKNIIVMNKNSNRVILRIKLNSYQHREVVCYSKSVNYTPKLELMKHIKDSVTDETLLYQLNYTKFTHRSRGLASILKDLSVDSNSMHIEDYINGDGFGAVTSGLVIYVKSASSEPNLFGYITSGTGLVVYSPYGRWDLNIDFTDLKVVSNRLFLTYNDSEIQFHYLKDSEWISEELTPYNVDRFLHSKVNPLTVFENITPHLVRGRLTTKSEVNLICFYRGGYSPSIPFTKLLLL